jgi:Protein of unknown function (DUF2568)
VTALRGVVLAARFGLEIGALVALGYWGFTTGDGTVTKIVLGLGAPLLAAVLWGLFASPKARFEDEVLRAIVELVVFGGAALALAAAGRPVLAIAFAVIALVDSVLVRLLDDSSAFSET